MQSSRITNFKKMSTVHTVFHNELIHIFGGSIESTDKKDVVDLSFIDALNDDVYHVILSFLDIESLNLLGLVSKKLRIGQLTTDDRYWENYYKQKVQEFKEGSKGYHYDYATGRHFYDHDKVFNKYEKINREFKINLIGLVSQYMAFANKEYHKRTVNIQRTDLNSFNTPFLTKEELLELVDVSKLPKLSSLKVVLVGDGGVGK